jgi:hypothetical protein
MPYSLHIVVKQNKEAPLGAFLFHDELKRTFRKIQRKVTALALYKTNRQCV